MQVQVLILHESVLSERKSRGIYYRAPSYVLVMIPKQTIHQGQMNDDTDNSQEGTSKKNHVLNFRLNPIRQEGYRCQDCNPKDELRSRGSQGIII